MSWQCAYCETVNQDAVPVCTVCDRLAPVVESYISLEKIECTTEYNEKLDLVHQLENDGEYEKMFDVAIEAIALYKDNLLAQKKAKFALKQMQEYKISKKLVDIINNAIRCHELNKVSCALDLWDEFNLCPTEVSEYKKIFAENIEKTKVIEEIITNVNKLIFNYQPLEAQQLIESVLPKFPTDERLLTLRDKVKIFVVKQNEYFDNTQTRRKFPKPIRPKIEMNDSHTVSSEESTIESPSKKRKLPKVKRNN